MKTKDKEKKFDLIAIMAEFSDCLHTKDKQHKCKYIDKDDVERMRQKFIDWRNEHLLKILDETNVSTKDLPAFKKVDRYKIPDLLIAILKARVRKRLMVDRK